jgi:ribulose-phosphate 3-epimerase
MRMPKIIPSVMAKNQTELNSQLKNLTSITKHIHLDIVDKNFANNKVMQFPFRLKRNFQYSAHLMIKDPLTWIKKNKSRIQFPIPQLESLKDPQAYLTYIKQTKKPAALAILPSTKINQIKPYIKELDYLLILTVKPGFYGSKFIPKRLDIIKKVKSLSPKLKIIIDGHMNPKTIKLANKAGADHFIVGSYLNSQETNKQKKLALKKLKQILN